MNKSNPSQTTSKKNFIRRMFDDISYEYDLLNRIISFGLDGSCRKKTVAPHEHDKIVLDICSGTGDMSIELSKQNGFEGMLILGDFSSRMHELARQKLNNRQSIYFVYCDAENLPFKNSTLDGIINGYSLRNLSDLKAFGSEIYRTLKPGGHSSIVDVSHPPNKIFAWLFYIYFYKLLPLISRLFTKKKYAYRYLPVSLRTFLKQEEALSSLKGERLEGQYQNILMGAMAIYRLKKSL